MDTVLNHDAFLSALNASASDSFTALESLETALPSTPKVNVHALHTASPGSAIGSGIGTTNQLRLLHSGVSTVAAVASDKGTSSANGTNSRPQFVYCRPGIPVAASDMNFGGLRTSEQVDAASYFSQLVNGVPAFSSTWTPTGVMIWGVYRQILETACFPKSDVTGSSSQQIVNGFDVARSQLVATTSTIDPVTSATRIVTDASALLNTSVVALLSGTNSYATSNVLTARATIDDATRRAPAAMFARLRGLLATDRRTDFNGSEFYTTRCFPASVFDDDHKDAWTSFSISPPQARAGALNDPTAGFASLIFYDSSGDQTSFADTSVTLSGEMVNLPLLRPWFEPSVLTNVAWKFATNAPFVSNGGQAPDGMMTLFPTAVMIARNVTLRFTGSAQSTASALSELSIAQAASVGPFSLRAWTSFPKSTTAVTNDVTSDTVVTRGAQIIGFSCRRLSRCPNPDAALDWT